MPRNEENPMTIKTSVPSPRRVHPIHEHAYTLPVVRELPAQSDGPSAAQSLW
jgi:hypothetical protein